MIAHIGFPKTGSTFLQSRIFEKIPDRFISSKEAFALFEGLITNDDLYFDAEKYKALFPQREEVVISLEQLVGIPFQGKSINRKSIGYRLKEVGTKKIIITIRNQVSAIDSYYRQFIHSGGVLNFDNFIENKGTSLNFFDLNYFEYYKTITFYRSIFGKDNVLILLFEELFNRNTLEKILKFIEFNENLELDSRVVNSSLSNFSINILRNLNHFFKSIINPQGIFPFLMDNRKVSRLLSAYIDRPFKGMVKKKNYVRNSELHEFLVGFYKESNQKLAEEIELDLGSYGYPVLFPKREPTPL